MARISAISKYAVLNVGVFIKILSDIANITTNFVALSPTGLKNGLFDNLFSAEICCDVGDRVFFSDVGDSTKKYKMAIFKTGHQILDFLAIFLVHKSPTHTDLIFVKNPEPNISCLRS